MTTLDDTATYYDPMSGEIECACVTGNLLHMDELRPDKHRVEGYFRPSTHYIDLADPENPVPTGRPTQSTQLVGLTLTALPANATLHIDGQSYPLTDTTVELDFPLPGTYRLRVTCWPYLDWTGEVTV